VHVLAEGLDSDGATPSTTTDAKGRFTLVDLAPDRYHLKGLRNGYLDGYYGARRAEGNGISISLQPGQEIKDLVLKLPPFGVIGGTVRDADGEPLARIAVTAHRLRFGNGRRRLVQTGGTYTDDLGQYRIPDLPPGKYYVHAESRKASDSGPNTASSFELQMAQETADHSPKGTRPPQALLPSLYPGVQDPSTARTVEVAAGARVTGVDVTLTRSATVPVRGHVTAPAGMQVSAIQLNYAHAESESVGLHLFASPNEKGDFEFGAAAPGSYILTASAIPVAKPFTGTVEIYQPQLKTRMPIEVGTTPVEGVRLVVEAGAEIGGHIKVDGNDPADLAARTIQFDDGQSDAISAIVGSDGAFKLTLPVGHYNVLTNFLGGGDLVTRSIRAVGRNVLDEGLTVAEPGKIAIEIVLAHDGGHLDGAAVDSDDKPVAGATVVLAPEARLRAHTELFQQSETDQYGRFTFERIAPGDYKVFTWDDVEPGAWWDPEFIKKYESQGEAVTIAAKGSATVKAHLARDK
jgi:hypothetical protein